LHVNSTVKATISDKSELVTAIQIEDKILSEKPHFPYRIFEELSIGGNRNPITPH